MAACHFWKPPAQRRYPAAAIIIRAPGRWSDGMFYPLLARLERLGYVSSLWGTSDAGRRCKHRPVARPARQPGASWRFGPTGLLLQTGSAGWSKPRQNVHHGGGKAVVSARSSVSARATAHGATRDRCSCAFQTRSISQ